MNGLSVAKMDRFFLAKEYSFKYNVHIHSAYAHKEDINWQDYIKVNVIVQI